MLTLDNLTYTEIPPPEYWIYALVDPRNNEVRYIGATKNVHVRRAFHQSAARSAATSVLTWTKELQAKGMTPRMVLLEHVHFSRMETVEHEWINKCLALGARLTNARLKQRHQQSNGNGHK